MHRVYSAIVKAVELGSLVEPFSINDFRKACPGFAEGTYKAFPYKHKLGNGSTSELFVKVGIGRFKLVKPIRYGL